MHRAIASYANGGAAPVLDDTTVLEQYGSLVERTAHRLISRTGLRSAYDDLWSAKYRAISWEDECARKLGRLPGFSDQIPRSNRHDPTCLPTRRGVKLT
jgi:hypothetical protein